MFRTDLPITMRLRNVVFDGCTVATTAALVTVTDTKPEVSGPVKTAVDWGIWFDVVVDGDTAFKVGIESPVVDNPPSGGMVLNWLIDIPLDDTVGGLEVEGIGSAGVEVSSEDVIVLIWLSDIPVDKTVGGPDVEGMGSPGVEVSSEDWTVLIWLADISMDENVEVLEVEALYTLEVDIDGAGVE